MTFITVLKCYVSQFKGSILELLENYRVLDVTTSDDMTDILVDDINCYEAMTKREELIALASVLSGDATVIMTEERGGRTSAFDCHWESTVV